jgi:ribosome maturation factor RimP
MVLRGPRSGMELKFYEIALKILNELNLEMYDLDWNSSSGQLCLYILNPKTKTALIEDCVKVDRAFTPYIESETWIPENLTLEVSSPGLFRYLTSIEHFRGVVGQEITLGLTKKIDETIYPEFPKVLRNNLKIKVKLIEVKDESIVFDARGVLVDIPYTQIKKANLETDFNNYNPDDEKNSEIEIETDIE